MANAWPWGRLSTMDRTQRLPMGLGEMDVDWGKKSYRGVDAHGKAWQRSSTGFGYKIHLLVDAGLTPVI